MFLLHINNNKLNNSLLKVKYLKIVKQNLLIKTKILNSVKQTKMFKTLSVTLNKKTFLNNLVKYIIGISFLKENLIIYVTDIKGNVKYFSSAGSVGILGKQKRKKSIVLVKLLQYLVTQIQFIDKTSVVLYFKNVTDFYVSLVMSTLKKTFTIEVVKIFNNKPFNGCRPKKLKRKRGRKIKF